MTDELKDSREAVATGMLDMYHQLKVEVATRRAIYHNLVVKGSSWPSKAEASDAVDKAQSELESVKRDILELMGLDV